MLDKGPILVALDGSETAERSLPYASAIAGALRTHLVLITVWEGPETELAATFPSLEIDIDRSAQEYFSNYLDGLRSRLSLPDSTRTVVRPGDASDEILKAVEETGARMIAMATHGRSGISRWIYGSTAGRILRYTHVPVLAVGPHTQERSDHDVALKHIMVPLDGSPLSEQALPAAATLAAGLGARVSLVRAVPWAVQSYPYSLPDAYTPQIDEELEKSAKAYLQKQEEPLKAKTQVSAFVVRGAVADGLMEFVEQKDVDLVVMTTHARKGLLRAALGSTADRMLQGKAPVLLVPPDVAEQPK